MGHRRSARYYNLGSSEPERTIAVSNVPAAYSQQLRDDPNVLAMLHFGQHNWTRADRPKSFGVGLPLLGTSDDTVEVWRARKPTRVLNTHDVALIVNEDCAFGHMLVDEEAHGDLQTATRFAYEHVLQTARDAGYPHILRVWHYFPRIHAVENGIERYQAFCIGRHAALSAAQDFECTLPAATAIGSHGSGLLLYFIAAATPGVQVENPRQVSAFRYPRQYGPESPSFSRAVLKRWPQGEELYISGTASVVGHASRHRHDLDAQMAEIVRNLGAVVEHARSASGRLIAFPETLSAVKVYVRNPKDYPHIAAALAEEIGPEVPALYLHGDICRTDLLLEVEAVCSPGADP